MKPFVAVLSIVALVHAAFDGCFLLADTPTTPAVAAPSPFDGKVVMIYLDKEARVPSYSLADATIQSIGGREFLVGVGADSKRPGDWTAGVKIRIAWSNVIAYMEFTSDEYVKFCADAAVEKTTSNN